MVRYSLFCDTYFYILRRLLIVGACVWVAGWFFLPVVYGQADKRDGDEEVKAAAAGVTGPARGGVKMGGESLNDAVKASDEKALEFLVAAGVPLYRWEGAGDDGLLAYCLRHRKFELVKVLLKHGADPDRWGREGATPLQMAIAMREAEMVVALLDAGADANQKLARPVSEGMLEITELGRMQWFLKNERRLTPLMMAANDGDVVMIKALLDHGAETEIRSGRYRLSPLNFASRRKDVQAMQVMLGKDPEKETQHIVIDLSDQQLRLYDAEQKEIFSTRVSTGKAGYATPVGEYVITDKHRNRRSTIYNVIMPYFQRLSSSSIGFHAGYCPGYPASHGCIRMPNPAAKKLFKTVPTGTRVVIQE